MSDTAKNPNVRDLTKLVWPFARRYIHDNPGAGNRGSYVKHGVVEQRILEVLGGVDFEVVRVIHGFVDGKPEVPPSNNRPGKPGKPALQDAVVGVIMRMRATVDGRVTTVEEAGDCEDPHNWPHDGARLKDAMSDAYKRCAMRIGVGLHLWASDDWYLSEKLAKQDGLVPEPAPAVAAVAPEPADSEPREPSSPQPEPTTAPPAQNGSQAPEAINWSVEAKSLGLTTTDVLKQAREAAKEAGMVEPIKMAEIHDALAPELFAKLAALAEQKGREVKS